MAERTTEKKTSTETSTPADIASLYSWANLHGAKYRDFSDSRQQTRAQSRHRMLVEQDNIAQQATAGSNAPLPVVEVPAPLPLSVSLPLEREAPPELPVIASAPGPASAPTIPSFASASAPLPVFPGYRDPRQDHTHQQPHDPRQDHSPRLTTREMALPQARADWQQRPGWFDQRPEPAYASTASAAYDTLQQSREQVASRWFALKGIFDQPADRAEQQALRRAELRVPALAVFSLAGGVGKTSLVATLGRVLASRGERVLLVDTTAYGLLPFYFGARDLRPNAVRTFTGSASEIPISVLSMDAERLGHAQGAADPMLDEMERGARGTTRMLIDVQTGSVGMTRRLLELAPTVLVPIVPDMNSVITLQAVDAFFRSQQDIRGRTVQPYYILNQFDSALPLHLDVREVLHQQLGDRLLPFALGRNPAVSEALAEGMTVVDYAPNCAAAEDYMNLSSWLRGITAPSAMNGFRAARWSER